MNKIIPDNINGIENPAQKTMGDVSSKNKKDTVSTKDRMPR
jgi:hypothetical protein